MTEQFSNIPLGSIPYEKLGGPKEDTPKTEAPTSVVDDDGCEESIEKDICAGDCVEFEGNLYLVEYLFNNNGPSARVLGFIPDQNSMRSSNRQVHLDQVVLRYSREK